jgi:hypothetical protein
MITDPRMNATQRCRWALWLFMFVGVVLHTGLCPANAHAGVVGATTWACAAPAAGAPPSQDAVPAPASGRAGEAGRPCAPPAHPHRHAPCVDVNHRGFSPERSTWTLPAGALPRCPLPADHAETGTPGVCWWGRMSRPAAPRSGAGLLVDLCSSRT